jgi:hypothetical protein
VARAAGSLGLGVVIIMMGVRRRVRVHEAVPMRVMLIAHRVDRVVSVRVGRGGKPMQQGQNRKTRTKPAHHQTLSSVHGLAPVKRAHQGPYNARMNAIRCTTLALLAAVGFVILPALVSAHEVTHNGTVIALKTEKYAQPNGGSREVRELEVAVVDPKTKKVANRVFTITDKKKITRAGKAVTVAAVTAQKDEKVAVVVDHDKPGDEALQVRFEAGS